MTAILEANDRNDCAPEPALYLPHYLAPYEQLFLAAGARHAVDPALIAAVVARESGGGMFLHPQGPGGTGDWTARTGKWLRAPGVKVVERLPPGWHAPKDRRGDPRPGPYAIPEDEQGWGRGLGQHDYGSQRDWLQSADWRDPAVNIDRTAALLADLYTEFPRALSSAVAAYNCGARNVRAALLDGYDCDRRTTGRNYSADVLRRRASFLRPPEAP